MKPKSINTTKIRESEKGLVPQLRHQNQQMSHTTTSGEASPEYLLE